jgi:DNA polymerase-3 subunit delta
MQITADRLAAHLHGAGAAARLKPVYVVCSDEPLLAQEATDSIRAAARAQGCTNRQVFDVERGFDTDAFLGTLAAASLFGDRTLADVRIPTGKPGKEAAAALETAAQWLVSGRSEDFLLVSLPRLNKTAMQAKWFAALQAAGVVVNCSPPSTAQLPAWIRHRLQQAGLTADPTAVEWLAAQVEGNLLAAQQEIDKLALTLPPGSLTLDTLKANVTQLARYGAFELGPAVLAGDAARVYRIVQGLAAEGAAPTLVLWALQEEIRALGVVQTALGNGVSLSDALRLARVWGERQPVFGRALKRHTSAAVRDLHRRAEHADKIAKGLGRDDVWHCLLSLALAIAGVPAPIRLESAA